ncbi:MAG: hypothetical protein IJ984_07355 [Prevotella sp.]|nr:hypothetical protein [Prevotella sp.]
MKLLLKRIAKKADYTIGHLYINGKKFCDTLEDTDRGLMQSLPTSVNVAKKKKGATAIPVGTYRVTLAVKSPRFSQVAQYKFCNGYLPRLVNVPAYDGVLIHIGNTAKDTEGCILVGRNTIKGMVTNSRDTFLALYAELQQASSLNEDIFITIE